MDSGKAVTEWPVTESTNVDSVLFSRLWLALPDAAASVPCLAETGRGGEDGRDEREWADDELEEQLVRTMAQLSH